MKVRGARARVPAVLALVASLWFHAPAVASAPDAPAPGTLFRVYLVDGSSVVSYGELTRVADQVIFSMPVGGTAREPRLHPVTLPAALIDWTRTERYALSARYQQYAPRAEADYQRLTDEVAAVLNDIALSTDRARALALARDARQALVAWPRSHFGYRQDDVREIVALIDAAIARLRGDGPATEFELALVAMPAPIELEPLAAMPTAAERIDQVIAVLNHTTSSRDRVALLRTGLAIIETSRGDIPGRTEALLRRSLQAMLREEVDLDRRYARMTQELMARAVRAASEAKIGDVERVLARVVRDDKRLGGRRPEMVEALTASVHAQLDRARRLRLLRDQWTVRRAVYRDYQRHVGSDVLQLVKLQPSLEAIRKLEGPAPDRLDTLRTRLAGGSTRLQRMPIPEYLRSTHGLVVAAWRFAENAANARHAAVSSGQIATAWEASSAAAGALMTLAKAQEEIRSLLEPPTLP